MKTLKLRLIKVEKILGVNFYTGSIKLGELFDRFEVPEYKPWTSPCLTESGYQRIAKSNRVDLIRDRMLSDVNNPQAFVDNINLNLRSEKAETYCKPVIKNDQEGGSFYELEHINELGFFQLVDGQTRVKGAKRAMHQALADKDFQKSDAIKETRVSINLTFSEDVFIEAYIFFLINEHAASIPPDGASRLLLEGYRAGKVDFLNEVTNSNKTDEIYCMKIAEKLAHNSHVWANRIKDFNEIGGGKIGIRAMSKIIQPLFRLICKNLKQRDSVRNPEDVVFEIIEAYWTGLKLVFPKMFKPENHKDYGVLKSSQAEVLMKVLRYLVDLSISGQSLGGKLDNPKVYQKILTKVFSRHTDTNALGNDIKGEALWLNGKSGAMGRYTSAAAKTDIASRLSREIDTILGRPTPQ